MPDEPPQPLLAFVDTPIFLECANLETLDFRGLLGAELVHVVVTPMVVDQIERFKDSPRKSIGGAKRSRAQARLAALETLLFPSPDPLPPEPVQRAPGLFVAWWDELDRELFTSERLIWEVEDHVLIAYALTARARGHRVALVTADVGARLRIPPIVITQIAPS